MRIRKAVITAAGAAQRRLPVQSLIDRDGQERTVLAILVEEILRAGVEEIAVVVSPGDEAGYAHAVPAHPGLLRFIPQPQPLGYGHAVWCARDFTAGEPFLHLVGDHLYTGEALESCAERLVEIARTEKCAVSAVQPTHESLLPLYGAVGGQRLHGEADLFRIEAVVEKPTPTEAEQKLVVPGLRAGYYLCFFGMHVLTPALMEILNSTVAAHSSGRITLSAALHALASRERYLASRLNARRYDVGVRYGLLTAQIALALNGRDRDEVLTTLVRLLASSSRAENANE